MVIWRQMVKTKQNSPDTFSPSYRPHATQGPGKLLQQLRKGRRSSSLPSSHWFSPIAIETMGAVGSKSMAFADGCGTPHSGGDRRPMG